MKIRELLAVSGALLILDQLSKFLVSRSFLPGESAPVFGEFFRITYVKNPGGVFGLSFGGIPLVPISLLAIVLLLMILLKIRPGGLTVWGIPLILGGALGNLADRLRLGEVIDFLDFGMGTLRWPTFNIADLAVVVGVALILIQGCKRQEIPDTDKHQ